ncbi:MAG: hypothetical protein GF390_01885 [Candidatus Pacebacteria bacterium]|nr:hypothetical protein [Candidatus Paceibacterota bacterium]
MRPKDYQQRLDSLAADIVFWRLCDRLILKLGYVRNEHPLIRQTALAIITLLTDLKNPGIQPDDLVARQLGFLDTNEQYLAALNRELVRQIYNPMLVVLPSLPELILELIVGGYRADYQDLDLWIISRWLGAADLSSSWQRKQTLEFLSNHIFNFLDPRHKQNLIRLLGQ